jgi:hypothetical protein
MAKVVARLIGARSAPVKTERESGMQAILEP